MIAPCYDKRTGKDCEHRQLGCRKTCALWQEYEAGKRAEYKARDEEILAKNIEFGYKRRGQDRLERRLHKR